MSLIKGAIKKIILLLPNGDKLLAKLIQLKKKPQPVVQEANVEEKPLANNSVDPKNVFTDYYRNNFWGNPESVSGAGSTVQYTENVRKELPKLLEEYKVQTFLDAPCGDFNWFQLMQRPRGMKYLGGDIVEELIKQNPLKFGDGQTRFFYVNVISEPLPQADLWMCRDCLFHFSYEDIFKTLANFLRSDIKYLFTSIHTECTANADIVTGGARQLNLELPPFNLCKPLLYVDDWIPGYTVRRMGLWTRDMVRESVAANPEVQKYL